MDARRHQQPDDFAAQQRVGHHRLNLAGEPPLGLMRVRPHPAQLGVGLVDEYQHARQGHQHAAQPLEDDVGLAIVFAAQILDDEHDHVQLGGDRLEDERLARTDRSANRRAG